MWLATNLWWILIIVCGMLGGLVYGLRDRELKLPRIVYDGNHSGPGEAGNWASGNDKEEKEGKSGRGRFVRRRVAALQLGCITDIFFGLAGGVVIFVVLPSLPQVQTGGWEFVKIAALALIGGYGGRVLVERVVNEQVSRLEKKVTSLEDRLQKEAYAIQLSNQQLTGEIKPDPRELVESFRLVSPNTRIQLAAGAEAFRMEAIYDLLGAKGNPELQRDTRQRFQVLIPVLKALIEADKKSLSCHEHYAHLAYVLKDQNDPDWQKAFDRINEAIQERDRQHVDEGFLIVYNFTRLVCAINLGEEFRKGHARVIKDDFEKVKKVDLRMLMLTDDLLAPELKSWLIDNCLQDAKILKWLQEDEVRERWLENVSDERRQKVVQLMPENQRVFVDYED